MIIRVLANDSKMANLAILKIAQYHINAGDNVGWYQPLFDQQIDKLYISKVFTFTDEIIYLPDCEIIKGGTGYDYSIKLPDEIEHITNVKQAYNLLYPEINYSVQFSTRGCFRKCGFCVVPKKEGFIHSVELMELNDNGEYIELIDNNFFNYKGWKERLEKLKTFDQPLNFSSGLDLRTLTEEQAMELSKCKIKKIYCAWDNIEDEEIVFRGVDNLIKYIPKHKIMCYVLVGFNTTTEQDLYRVNKLNKYGIDPFAMGYIDFEKNIKPNKKIRNFCRWVNHKAIFKTVKWEDYKG